VALAVQFPEEVSSVRCDELVERIAGLSLGEGWMLGVQNEQDDSKSKQINYVALVWLLIEDLWTHIGRCAHHGCAEAGLVTTLQLNCEPEINNLSVVFLVEQDIFRLQVTVADAVRVKVVQAHQNLFEVKSADLGGE
jgi:hypothetical protein